LSGVNVSIAIRSCTATIAILPPSIQLATTSNLLDKGPQSSLMLVMPIIDTDGDPLSDGITCGVSFGDNITTLTWLGAFRNAPPASASAGQVRNFRYSVNTNSWWNA
jgi:hypothetical protein